MNQRAYINPEMMKWARQYAGFVGGYEKELPKQIKGRFESWESGQGIPTWNQLNEVSECFNVPTAFFFMKSHPKADPLPYLIDCRALDGDSIYNLPSPNLISDIRKSQRRREIYLGLAEELNEDVCPFNVPNLKRSEESFSRYIGKALYVQKPGNGSSDSEHYNLIDRWKEALNERFGVLAFETEHVEISEMKGLCILYDKAPIILLNGRDGLNSRIFTLLHELAHLLLGQSAICGDMDGRKEEFCNCVAGQLLAPVKDLSKCCEVRKDNYLNNQIRCNGEPYCSMILEAYDEGIISSLEFSRYSGLSRRQISLLYQMLQG